ncbi:MAG: type IV toxin-antitoxin system AbiEi family antitoxin domain-containing protein [Mycobacteriales bacterium]
MDSRTTSTRRGDAAAAALEADSGLIHRSRARRRGLSDDDISNLIRRGRWVRLQPGIYAPRPTPLVRARGAVAAARGPATASHATAARVHEIPILTDQETVTDPSIEHITVDRDPRVINRSLLRIHTRQLSPDERCHIGGVPLTTPARTVADLLMSAPDALGLWAAERCLAMAMATTDQIVAALGRAGRVPGIRAARARFAQAQPRSESPFETMTRLVIVDAGLPEPRVQVPICDSVTGEVWFRIDMGYPELRLGIECDGKSTHTPPPAVYRDRRRQNHLQLLGWTLIRVTWYDVMQRPSYVVWLIRQALADAA